jgi:ribosomal protein S12 methylthiotransferase accessory factor
MGISRLADITGLDLIGIPVVQAVRPLGRSLSVAQGKGIDLDAAMASAAMEAAEGWHAEDLRVPTRRGTLRELMREYRYAWLPGGQAVDPDACLTFVEARNLVTGDPAWLPWDLVHKDYTLPPEVEAFCRSTNGLASGNTIDEALAAALHELVERDATADFELAADARRDWRRILPERVAALDPGAATLIERIQSAGLALWLYDMTHDLSVPCVRADIAEVRRMADARGRPVRRLQSGRGCHLCPATAAVRAITEAAQSRLTDIAGSRDDLDLSRYETPDTGNIEHLLAHAADVLDHGVTSFDYADASCPTPAGDVARLVERLSAAGLDQVLAVDLSRPDIPVAVARVVVPGLGYLEVHRPRRGARHLPQGTS